jgi:hypothetical protein
VACWAIIDCEDIVAIELHDVVELPAAPTSCRCCCLRHTNGTAHGLLSSSLARVGAHLCVLHRPGHISRSNFI